MIVPFLDLKAHHAPILDEINRAIQDVIDSSAFAGGPFVADFESDFASYCDVPHAIGVGNGTEALWLSFQPPASDPRGWMLNKSGADVSPFEVVSGGNRGMHAVLGGLRYNGPEGKLSIESLDAPVVALGKRMPVYFSRSQPDLNNGFHFSLFNNGWGTNYIQWFGEDMCFRFRLTVA